MCRLSLGWPLFTGLTVYPLFFEGAGIIIKDTRALTRPEIIPIRLEPKNMTRNLNTALKNAAEPVT